MDATPEMTDLAARIAQLPDDAQLELAWQVLRRFGYRDGPDPEWEAGMKAEVEALLEWERAGKPLASRAASAAGCLTTSNSV